MVLASSTTEDRKDHGDGDDSGSPARRTTLTVGGLLHGSRSGDIAARLGALVPLDRLDETVPVHSAVRFRVTLVVALCVLAVGACSSRGESVVEDTADVPCRLDGSHVRDAFGHAISGTAHGSNDEVWYLGTKYAVDYNHPFAGSRRTLEDRRNQTPEAVTVQPVGDGAFFGGGRSGSPCGADRQPDHHPEQASFQRVYRTRRPRPSRTAGGEDRA